MDQENFKKLKKMVNSTLQINEDNVAEKSRKIPYIQSKYAGILVNEIEIYKKLDLNKIKIHAEKYKYYKEEYSRELNKTEIEIYINNEEIYQDILSTLSKQSIIVKYLEETLTNIKAISFNIKNYIDIKKYFEGIL